MNVGQYMAYILYVHIFFLYTKKKGGFGGPIFFVMSLWQFLAILAIKMADF